MLLLTNIQFFLNFKYFICETFYFKYETTLLTVLFETINFRFKMRYFKNETFAYQFPCL